MADQILVQGTSNSTGEPDRRRLFCYGELPAIIGRIKFDPVPGKWHVQASCRSGALATLGAIADGFETMEDAKAWRDQRLNDVQLRDLCLSVGYTPTEADRARLCAAPQVLDVPVLIVEAETALDDGAVGRQWAEAWASRSEALRRVEQLTEQGVTARIAYRQVRLFSRDEQSLLERDAFIRQINGDTAPLEDGSVWSDDSDLYEDRGAMEGRRARGPAPGRYNVVVYSSPEVREVSCSGHLTSAVFATGRLVGEFPDQHAASRAGWQALAADESLLAFITWPCELPDDLPRYCYVARSDRSLGGRVIPSSRLSGFFEGPERYERARDERDRLKAQWPDAGVFYATDRRRAVRPQGVSCARRLPASSVPASLAVEAARGTL